MCTDVRFSSLLSGGFVTAVVVNLPERKLTKRTSVHCGDLKKQTVAVGLRNESREGIEQRKSRWARYY